MVVDQLTPSGAWVIEIGISVVEQWSPVEDNLPYRVISSTNESCYVQHIFQKGNYLN